MNEKKTDSRGAPPKGLGIAIGISLGVAIGTALRNVGLGLGVGLSLGAALEVIWSRTRRPREDGGPDDDA